MFANERVRAERRQWPIHGYVGPNGSGKSALMVWDTMPALTAGRPVLSTVRLLDYDDPRLCDDPGCAHPEHETGQVEHLAAHPLWMPFTEWTQLLEAEHCDVLMDEVTGVASSRESHSMPAPVANALVQMRRKDVIVRWSAPAWGRSDVIIRECSQAVTYCTGHMPKKVHSEPGEPERLWRQRRMTRARTYDATLFDDFTSGKREDLKPLAQQLLWLPKIGVFDAYDTYDSVLTIGTVSEGGTCYRCGGRRSRPTCSCDGPQGRRGPRGAGAASLGDVVEHLAAQVEDERQLAPH